MKLRRTCSLLGVAVLATATAADAAIHRVFPGESIQAAIDAASPGDTILVEPGTYQETGNASYGLHVTTDDLRLIGRVKHHKGEAGKTARVFTTTMGASQDFESEGLRRLLVNATYWALGMEDEIPGRSEVGIVGRFEPTRFNFNAFKKGVRPADHEFE